MPLNLIFNADSPDQSEQGALDAFDSTGNAPEEQFVRGDVKLAISLRPVVPASPTDSRPWNDDFQTGDTFQVGIGNLDKPPTDGNWPLGVFSGNIFSATVASPTEITCDQNHNLVTGNTVIIAGSTGYTPAINGTHVVTVTSATKFTITVAVTVAGSGGIVYDATGATNLDSAITTSALDAIISPLSVKHGYASVSTTLLSTGVYQPEWQANGFVPPLYSPSQNDLIPDSQVIVVVDEAGTSELHAIQIIQLRQSPVAYCEPSTPFPDADVTNTITQAGDPTHNKIYSTSFTSGTYGGTFSVNLTLEKTVNIISVTATNPGVVTCASSHNFTTGDTVTLADVAGSTPDVNGDQVVTVISDVRFSIPVNVTVMGTGGTASITKTETVGVSNPFTTATQWVNLLASHSLSGGVTTNFQATVQNQIITTTFQGAFANSNAPVIVCANIDLLAPKGVSGFIYLNTTSLARGFFDTDAETLTYTLGIRRTRSTGEEASIFQHDVVLKRSLLDALTMIAVPLPEFYTKAESDARFAKLHINGIRWLPDSGEIIIYSPNSSPWKLTVSNFGEPGFSPA